jgi:hypothetical protein
MGRMDEQMEPGGIGVGQEGADPEELARPRRPPDQVGQIHHLLADALAAPGVDLQIARIVGVLALRIGDFHGPRADETGMLPAAEDFLVAEPDEHRLARLLVLDGEEDVDVGHRTRRRLLVDRGSEDRPFDREDRHADRGKGGQDRDDLGLEACDAAAVPLMLIPQPVADGAPGPLRQIPHPRPEQGRDAVDPGGFMEAVPVLRGTHGRALGRRIGDPSRQVFADRSEDLPAHRGRSVSRRSRAESRSSPTVRRWTGTSRSSAPRRRS